MSDTQNAERPEQPLIEQLGWVVLLLEVLVALWLLGGLLGCLGTREFVRELRGYTLVGSGTLALLALFEFLMIPIGAVTAAMWPHWSDRVRAARESRFGPFLPLMMAASIVVVAFGAGIFSFSYLYADVARGPYVYVSWIGTVVALTFALFWQPLFPRVIAIIAGTIAGIAIYSLFGFLFFESSLSHGGECRGVGPLVATVAVMLGFVLLSNMSVLWLSPFVLHIIGFYTVFGEGSGPMFYIVFLLMLGGLAIVALVKRARITARPLSCAVVSGLLAAGMTFVGGDFGFYG